MSVSRFKSYVPYALSIAALFIFATYVYHNADRYRQLLNLSLGSLLLLVSLALVFPLANGLINHLLYRSLGATLPFNESFGLAAVNTLANQLPFAGGLVAKGVYLKQRYNLAYVRFLSATVALYLCFIAANGVIGLIVIVFLALAKGTGVPTLMILGFVAMTISFLLLKIPLDFPFLSEKWERRLAQVASGWQILSQNEKLLFGLIGIQVLTTALAAGRFWIAFHALSQDVTLTQCLLFAASTVLTRLVSIAPGGLGVREGIVAGLASVLGFETGVSAVAVGLDRLVSTAIIIALGAVYTYILSKKVAQPLETGAK